MAQENIKKDTADENFAEIRAKGTEAMEALHDTSAKVARQSSEAVTQMVEEGAHRAQELREEAVKRGNAFLKDMNAAYDTSKEFARRNPALVIAGAALAGYALSRTLRDTAGQSHAGSSGNTSQTPSGPKGGTSRKSSGKSKSAD